MALFFKSRIIRTLLYVLSLPQLSLRAVTAAPWVVMRIKWAKIPEMLRPVTGTEEAPCQGWLKPGPPSLLLSLSSSYYRCYLYNICVRKSSGRQFNTILTILAELRGAVNFENFSRSIYTDIYIYFFLQWTCAASVICIISRRAVKRTGMEFRGSLGNLYPEEGVERKGSWPFASPAQRWAGPVLTSGKGPTPSSAQWRGLGKLSSPTRQASVRDFDK